MHSSSAPFYVPSHADSLPFSRLGKLASALRGQAGGGREKMNTAEANGFRASTLTGREIDFGGSFGVQRLSNLSLFPEQFNQ